MIAAADIGHVVKQIIPEIATSVRPDVLDALKAAAHVEGNPRGQEMLDTFIANSEIAAEERVPLCQDTGTVWVLVELGDEEQLTGNLAVEVNAAVAQAFGVHGLRMSVVSDALFDRSNTTDNTPAFIEISQRPGRGATVHVMLKGGGSDNASALTMLPPSAGWEGVRDFVLSRVKEKASSACPPLIVGVAVGGTFDKVAGLSKRALLRPLSAPPVSERHAAYERELLQAINATGIGPGGLGGSTTALTVHLETAPSHIAALPVAVNMGCWALRSKTVEVL